MGCWRAQKLVDHVVAIEHHLGELGVAGQQGPNGLLLHLLHMTTHPEQILLQLAELGVERVAGRGHGHFLLPLSFPPPPGVSFSDSRTGKRECGQIGLRITTKDTKNTKNTGRFQQLLLAAAFFLVRLLRVLCVLRGSFGCGMLPHLAQG